MGSRALESLNLADKSTSYIASIDIDSIFEKALRELYELAGVDTENIPILDELFNVTYNGLNKGITLGFSDDFGKADPEFLNQFKYNAAIFAAFKTHAQQKEIVSQLLLS